MVLDPVVEEPKDVLPVVVSCQDGESVGVPFGPVHQCFVFITDGYSYCCLWNVKQFVLHFTVVAKREILIVEHRDVAVFLLFSVVACDSDV